MKHGSVLLAAAACLLAASACLAAAGNLDDPPVQDMCKRRMVMADCLRNHPTKVRECEQEADRESLLPRSAVPPQCAASSP